ncbi:DUF3021 domain-containing protein [Carnobacteriaceae bacterium zg-ZUI240]|nr:DUF3021 domain-containing protein [Carnobacteriaceae bacterium zg-ZUI240]
MFIKKAIIRGGIPFVIMTGISLIMIAQNMDAYDIKSTFISGLAATAIGAFSVIYEIEKWSLFKQSAIHFIAMLCTVYPCLLTSSWFVINSPMDYLVVFGIFLAVGVVMWTISYFIFGRLLNDDSTKKPSSKK